MTLPVTSPGLYVHLPFCPYICPYCDFAKWPHRRSAASRYLEALHAEIDRTLPVACATLFFGGGTPNAYDAETIAALAGRLRERFDLDAGAEVTIELNPELVRRGDFDAYREAGITRISIGVQSFDPAETATLGRRHTGEEVARAVSSARAAGIPSISLDLMFGIPGQTVGTFAQSLRRAVALEVDHISAYGLTVEENTPYGLWRQRDPNAFFSDDAEAELYDRVITDLESAGFEHYEISNFARPGHRCRHNANYWDNGEYLGLGVGAASYRNGERSVHTPDLNEYIDAAKNGDIPSESERLTGFRRVGEAVMLALRTAQGVSRRRFKERYHLDVLDFYAPIVARCSEAGLLDADETGLRLTRRGRFLANDVCAAFVTFA